MFYCLSLLENIFMERDLDCGIYFCVSACLFFNLFLYEVMIINAFCLRTLHTIVLPDSFVFDGVLF